LHILLASNKPKRDVSWVEFLKKVKAIALKYRTELLEKA
jgi:hypothetical protein